MLEFTKWLADEDVPFEPYPFQGYASLGITMEQLRSSNYQFPPMEKRHEAIAKFSFAIPSIEALEAIALEGPILEVGSGSGYWAYELRKLGVDIIATDPEPYSDNCNVVQKAWCNILPMSAERALIEYGSDRTLMFCWPSYNVDWPTNALKQYSGKTVIYIGEWQGCTANEEFHSILDEQFVEKCVIEIPQWSCIHDKLFILGRKT